MAKKKTVSRNRGVRVYLQNPTERRAKRYSANHPYKGYINLGTVRGSTRNIASHKLRSKLRRRGAYMRGGKRVSGKTLTHNSILRDLKHKSRFGLSHSGRNAGKFSVRPYDSFYVKYKYGRKPNIAKGYL